jgi:8-oxo-dGTP diphosphatase
VTDDASVVRVVGAAILADAPPRVLAAQRAAPEHLAGLWEFPGGKAEDGEADLDALVRECREELLVDVAVGPRLGDDIALGDGSGVLRVWTARLVEGHPHAVEHRALRWLTVDELYDVEWIPADLPLVHALRALLDG